MTQEWFFLFGGGGGGGRYYHYFRLIRRYIASRLHRDVVFISLWSESINVRNISIYLSVAFKTFILVVSLVSF